MKKSLLLFALLISTSAYAQTSDNDAIMERMDRMDHDIQLLQRQLARGGTPAASGDTTGSDAASLQVQLSAIQDDLRGLRGKIEENEFQIKKLSDGLDKLQRDTDFRFNDLKNNAGTPPPSPIAPMASSAPATPTLPPPINLDEPNPPKVVADNPAMTLKPLAESKPTPKPSDDVAEDSDNTDETPAAAPQSFATPRDAYNYAFRLLNQTQYEEAATAFEAFTKKYPKDPLVGNAYYWQGETYYIRHDYVSAADSFRQGFESTPDGPKAPDNLLKLAMSLDALNRDKEACVVLGQVVAKFKKTAGNVAQKAEQEQKRISCK